MDAEKFIAQEDLDIDYVRAMRKKMITKIVGENQENLPIEPKEVKALGSLLADMDRTAIASKRLKLEEESNKNNNDNAAMIAKMLTQISGVNMTGQLPSSEVKAPQLPPGLEPPTIVPGMLDTHPGSETFAEFKKKMQDLEDSE